VVPGPDPLGKLALFWMPVEPEAQVGIETARATSETKAPPRHSVRRARPAGKRALFSEATPASEEERAGWAAMAADPVPPRGLFIISCSSCGSVSRIGLFGLLWCQLPISAWLPRRTFDRWMTCPLCRRRTWTSVTLAR
jgi:hypothetical protein